MKELSIAMYQLEIISGNKKENLNKVEDMVKKHKKKEIDLWILPELFTTGFKYDSFEELAEEIETSNTIVFLELLSKEFSVGFAGSYLGYNKENDMYKNVGFIIDPSKGLDYMYNKIHLWMNEKDYFETGTEITHPINFNNKAKIGLQICYDLRFPEVSRNLVNKGAEIIITTASWPAARTNHFQLLANARALENTVYHIAVNRIGKENDETKTKYAGSSMVIDPYGNIISAASNVEQAIFTTLYPEVLEKSRKLLPVLKDRKIEFY